MLFFILKFFRAFAYGEIRQKRCKIKFMSKQNHQTKMKIVLMRGGGDLASGVALRLHHVGIRVIITELPEPLAVRRLVAFSEAIYQDKISIEEVTGVRVSNIEEAIRVIKRNDIPVLIDPDCDLLYTPQLEILAMVDARMMKRAPDLALDAAPLVIGLGPGFIAGENCHAVIETNRGHYLGRVIWRGEAEANTGVPGKVGIHQNARVLRAPAHGKLNNNFEIGSTVSKRDVIAEVLGKPILAPFDGVLRGLLRNNVKVHKGMKVGDLDPRNDLNHARTVSEKSLAIGGGVLEALLTKPEIRGNLWS